MTSVVSPKWLVFCCAQFGLWRGARREHPPQWGCDRRATKPQAKLGAARRAAVLFAPGFVARSLQIHFGICSSLAPRLERKALAAKHQPFRRHNTKAHLRRPRSAACLKPQRPRKPERPGTVRDPWRLRTRAERDNPRSNGIGTRRQ